MNAKRAIFIGVLMAAFAVAASLFWKAVPGGADANDPVQVALGQKVYADACASCHGDKLQGEPNWRSRKADGTLAAPPHDDSGHTWHHPDQLLFNYTKKGGEVMIPGEFKSGMPGFGDALSDAQMWAVLAYIKSQWSPRIRALQNQRNQLAN